MNIKPIKSESDYDAALAEVADLMEAQSGTPEGDRLDVLVTLVEAYEEKHWRGKPPGPTAGSNIGRQQPGGSRRGVAEGGGGKEGLEVVAEGAARGRRAVDCRE